MVLRFLGVPRMVSEEFGGWIRYFRGQGIWHGIAWLWCHVVR